MARGGYPGYSGGGNMNKLMKQAQKLQRDMEKMQADLDEMTVNASSGGGAVTVVISGKRELVSIEIEPEVVDPEDTEMLQDLIIAAVNEGIRKADDLVNSEMGKLAGGMGSIPGLF